MEPVARLAPSLKATLRQASTERPVHRWLEKHPLVLSACLQGIVYPNQVVSQFKFGTDFVADFVAFGAFSGACCFHFVELEPPGAPLFTKNGVAARRLNGALAQIMSWKTFIEKRRDEVLRELAKAFRQRELVFKRKGLEPTDTTGMPLYDPSQWIIFYHHVLIGRRENLTKAELGKKAAYATHSDVDLMTYDRLLDQATAFDQDRHAGIHDRPQPRAPRVSAASFRELLSGLR